MSSTSATVRVPASTSNCGPGFDTLGLAFNLYNEVRVSKRDDRKVVYAGNHTRFQERELAMVEEVAAHFFNRSRLEPFGFSFDIYGDVPLARGLGSSVTVRAGILGGLNALAGSPLDRETIIGIVSEIEGHPDNAAAAISGGFCVARIGDATGDYRGSIRFPVSGELVFVTAIPGQEIETATSRRALPESLPFNEVVQSVNSAAYLVAAMASGDFEKLRGAVKDFIHEPYRFPYIPGALEVLGKGIEAGAYAGWLSGSGSTVLCVAREGKQDPVSAAMEKAFTERGITCAVRALKADNEGMVVTD